MHTKDRDTTSVAAGPWDPALALLRECDASWADRCVKISTNPWRAGVLPRKFIELVGVPILAGELAL